MSETLNNPLIEPRCNGCGADEFEKKLRKLDEESAVRATDLFMGALEKVRDLLKDDPNLWQRRNKIIQQLEQKGILADEEYEGLTSEEVVNSAINCGIMQTNGSCRLINPLDVPKA